MGPFFRHTLGSALRISKVVVRANTAMERTKGRRGRKTERIRATRLQHQQSSVPSHINIKSPHLKSKHAHGTTFLVLKSLGPILCNNPPLKTSKFPTFLGEPFCSPVPPQSFIFPPVPAPPLNNGIDIFVMLDFSFFRNFVFSGCPVWPRFVPTASTNQVLRFNGVFWAYLTGFRPHSGRHGRLMDSKGR